MNTLVALFEYKKTKYYIYLLKNKRIIFLKSNKYNKFTSNLTKKETPIPNLTSNEKLTSQRRYAINT